MNPFSRECLDTFTTDWTVIKGSNFEDRLAKGGNRTVGPTDIKRLVLNVNDSESSLRRSTSLPSNNDIVLKNERLGNSPLGNIGSARDESAIDPSNLTLPTQSKLENLHQLLDKNIPKSIFQDVATPSYGGLSPRNRYSEVPSSFSDYKISKYCTENLEPFPTRFLLVICYFIQGQREWGDSIFLFSFFIIIKRVDH